MKFQNFVVLGTGTLALFCAEKLKEKRLQVTLYEMDPAPSGILKRRAAGMEIAYRHEEPAALFEKLRQTEEPTLLVSAINPYILPDTLLANPEITAINCHQALLPNHPGRNAEMWAIYEGDEKTGITWHILTEQVDAGDILIQKEMKLDRTHTAYQVFREQIALAQEAFCELLPELLEGSQTARAQEMGEKRRLHYSKDVPNQGFLNPEWDAGQISRFLRSMDYSILHVVPRPRLRLGAEELTIKKYKIIEEQRYPDGIYPEAGVIWLQKPGVLFGLFL